MTEDKRFSISIVLIDNDGRRIVPEFVTPLVQQLKPNSEDVNVDIHFEDGQLTIQRNDISKILFRRPPYCPFTNLYFQNNSSIISVNPSNAIMVGVVILFECHDSRVLLTRRASHMRTYPSCWVCPGGGVERNETLIQAGIRELSEEVGIEVSERELDTSRVLGLWESSFPVDLSHGLPRRHHIVIYIHVRSSRTSEEISVKVDPNEVDAYTWLSYEQIHDISKRTNSDPSRTFNAHIYTTGSNELLFDLLATSDFNQKENLTSGTRFALEQLYLLQS
ncbi:unnamed protein product [Adineta ricciae]|uniref:m7GpppN-mRNA hydrolase NUDT17 n=1 Tax=Adineta ricciae TaxID=249248 RepID=A0A814XTB8_ADIRI|nr:unnamed protein product [Adineta ricciae]CAF1283691.1 unnamed protein product [Adineta ricciae]